MNLKYVASGLESKVGQDFLEKIRSETYQKCQHRNRLLINVKIRELSTKAPPGAHFGTKTRFKYFHYAELSPSYYSVS